jgi:lipopolysaccharide/colanic/teichoic acid biosynthesis glycosyltransferase
MTNVTDVRDQSIYSLPAGSEYSWIEKIDPNEALFKGAEYLFVKRIMDITLIMLSMPILLPVFLLIALLIKIESHNGPVIFSQNRTGKGGKRFKMYKFRSMVPDAEELKKELAHLNELQWPDFKITNDPRVTRIGNILRRTSLDELPQLINVLKGEMSLVGPRPTSFAPDTYDLWQTVRLEVTPGLTGLWQIIGRAETEFYERLRLDIMYIKHRSVWLDVQILFRTVLAVIAQRGAH